MLKKIKGRSADILLSFARRYGIIPRQSEIKSLDIIKFECSQNYDDYCEKMFVKTVVKTNLMKVGKQYKNYDYPKKYIDDVYDKYSNEHTGNVCSIPFIDEGVLDVIPTHNVPFKAYFKVTDFNKECGMGNILVAIYEKTQNNYMWCATFQLEDYNFFINPIQALKEAKGGYAPITIGALAYGVIENKIQTDIPNENKMVIKKELAEYSSYPNISYEDVSVNSLYLTETLCSFGYINKQLEQYKDVEQVNYSKSDTYKQNNKNNVIYEYNSTNDKRKYLLIGKDITVKIGDNSHIQSSTINSKKTIHRLVDVWSVRGHLRHYKNGKEVYIHPYQKGQNRATGKPQPKTYIIADKDNDEIDI